MRPFILALTLFPFLLSCSQTGTKEKELSLKEKELQLKERELQLKEDSVKSSANKKDENPQLATIMPGDPLQNNFQAQADILNKWLAETIGCDFPVDPATVKKAGFNSFNYEKKAASIFINSIEVKENGKKPKISSSDKLITLSFSDDEGYETFFAEENKFTYSHHLSAGSNGGSTVYDLTTQKVRDYPFTFQSIKNGIAVVGRDGYGFDNGEPTGHWWQQGKLNIATGNITWGEKEY